MNKNNPAHENGKIALQRVKQFLNEIGWDPQKTDNEEVLLVDFNEDNTPIRDAHFDVRMEFERFVCYFNFRDTPSKDQQKELVEFITRANFNLVIGNFEFDYESGKIRFKSSFDFSNEILTETLIRNTIQSAMDVVEQYADVLVEVLRGNITAQQAILEAEKSLS